MNRLGMAYYARPMSIYGSEQERRDIATIERLGYQIIEFTEEMQERAKEEGMAPFVEAVRTAHILLFRSFPCGRIGAGVREEMRTAHKAGIPVLELPTLTPGREMIIEETKRYLRYSGQR